MGSETNYWYSDQQKELAKELEALTTMRVFPWNEMKDFINHQGEYKNGYGGEELLFVNAMALHRMKTDYEVEIKQLKDDLKAARRYIADAAYKSLEKK